MIGFWYILDKILNETFYLNDFYLIDITFLECKKGNETPGPQKNQEQEEANNVSTTSFLHRSLPVWVMLDRFSMGVSGIHRFFFLIRATTSHLKKSSMIQRSIKTDNLTDFLLFVDFLLLFLDVDKSRFSQVFKKSQGGRCQLFTCWCFHPNWQATA